MRWKSALTLGFAGFAAIVPWTVGGDTFADPRHQRRQEAAEILRNALRESADTARSGSEALDRYRSAVARAVQLAGPGSRAAAELADAVRQAERLNPTSAATLQLLRERIEQICETLSFAPTMEAEMPQGFPPPTPIGEVELKQYPGYRMAQSESGADSAFWTLFKHIKRENIAMTAPVEMSYPLNDTGEPRQQTMAFLYGSPDLGATGTDGSVRVVDVPAQTVISTGVRGGRDRQKIDTARSRLADWLDGNRDRFEASGEMRVMGYNSPFVPRSRSYFEVQIPVAAVEASVSAPRAAAGFELLDYVWKNRVLLVFAPSDTDEQYVNLTHRWDAERDAVSDRDLLLVGVFEEGESRAGDEFLPSTMASSLREQFEVDSGVSTFILIGKDGTVKLRRPEVPLAELFDVIDAMPMRRAEMRQG